MWKVFIRSKNGDTTTLEPFVKEGGHIPLRDLIPIANDMFAGENSQNIPWHLLYGTAETGPAPWADPIPVWATEAETSESGISIRRRGEDLRIESEIYGMSAWQHPTVFMVTVPPDAIEMYVLYEWDDYTPQPIFTDFSDDAEGEILPTLDGRLYAGVESAILEVDAVPTMFRILPEMLADRRTSFGWLMNVTNRAGLFVGRLARRAIRRPAPVIADPGFLSRLQAEEASNEQGRLCPRIENLPNNQPVVKLVIAVHGTFSCAVDLASHLRVACPSAVIARFEHDTFLPLSANVSALVQYLGNLHQFGLRELLLVAHSRGGLVACQAALILQHRYPQLKTKVWTAGTPHNGTPVAGYGGVQGRVAGGLIGGTLAVYYRMAARLTGNSLRVTTAEGAGSYLLTSGHMPPGITVMRPGSTFIDMHRLQVQSIDLKTWGARCDPTSSGESGHGILFQTSAAASVFDNEDNDLIVPTASAILDGSSPIERCNHFHYFDHLPLNALLNQEGMC